MAQRVLLYKDGGGMLFAQVQDIRMYYEVHGQGPRLLAISGTAGDLRRKPNIFDTPLAAHFETLSYDQRGFGQTDKPDAPYSMAGYADDADALLEMIGWPTCHVLGTSFGGTVAQELALRYPHRVVKLVLACTGSGGAGGPDPHRLDFLFDQQLSAEQQTRQLISLTDTRRDKAWQHRNPVEVETMVRQREVTIRRYEGDPDLMTGLMRQQEARRHHDTYDRLPTLRIPVLICGGRYDGVFPPETQRALHRQIPNAQLMWFEGGHRFLHQDSTVYERIVSFLLSP